MATNFPGSADSFTNPTSGSSLSSPSHADQHTNVNDAVEAIETALLDGAPLHIDDVNERVGIGTTSPATTLEVAGAAAHIRITDSDTAGTTGIDFYDSDGTADVELEVGNSTQYFAIKTAGSEAMRIDSSGNVGIGTTSPSSILDLSSTSTTLSLSDSDGTVGGSMSAMIQYKDSSGSVQGQIGYGTSIGYMIIDNNDGPMRVGTASADSLYLRTNNTDVLTIDSAGDVGIGTTSISNQFEVYNGTYYSIIGRKDWGLRSTGTYALSTSAGANVYISTNGTFYRSTSSGKYKTDVEDMDTSAADIVFALRPVWFRSTSPLDPEGWSYYGLIAEEVAEVDPRLVSFGAREDCGCDADADHVADCLTEPEGVYYDRLVPHLINVVQRQQAQINELVARIEALEAG